MIRGGFYQPPCFGEEVIRKSTHCFDCYIKEENPDQLLRKIFFGAGYDWINYRQDGSVFGIKLHKIRNGVVKEKQKQLDCQSRYTLQKFLHGGNGVVADEMLDRTSIFVGNGRIDI